MKSELFVMRVSPKEKELFKQAAEYLTLKKRQKVSMSGAVLAAIKQLLKRK